MATKTRDTNIWRELEADADGYIPAIPRRWLFIGRRRGADCRFECELTRPHPSMHGVYEATAVFAHNVHYLCRDWVRLDELEPIG